MRQQTLRQLTKLVGCQLVRMAFIHGISKLIL